MMRKSGRLVPLVESPMRTTTPPADVSRVACARATLGGLRIEIGAPLDELAHDRVTGLLDLVDRADGAHAAVVQHCDPCPDAVGASHVVCDDNARDAEPVAHADHELVDHGAGDGIEPGG